MRKWMYLAATFLFTVVTVTGVALAADDEATIKKVMKEAMKKGALLTKVNSGKASLKDKEELVVLFKELAKAKPEKGPEADWKKKTTALLSAAEDELKGKSGAIAELKKAANCKACHDVHKGE